MGYVSVFEPVQAAPSDYDSTYLLNPFYALLLKKPLFY